MFGRYSWAQRVLAALDGTREATERIGRVLWDDSATGVMRHADASYPIAIDHARRMKLDLPSIDLTS